MKPHPSSQARGRQSNQVAGRVVVRTLVFWWHPQYKNSHSFRNRHTCLGHILALCLLADRMESAFSREREIAGEVYCKELAHAVTQPGKVRSCRVDSHTGWQPRRASPAAAAAPPARWRLGSTDAIPGQRPHAGKLLLARADGSLYPLQALDLRHEALTHYTG